MLQDKQGVLKISQKQDWKRWTREMERVCVTGAGGFIASWLVKFLLQRGYMVHGTVRDPCDKKNAHLLELENSLEKLQLFKTDLFDFEGLCGAFSGCTVVFHVACPVPFPGSITNPEVQIIEPAVIGTQNVLNACSQVNIKRVVLVSSCAAVLYNPDWPKDQAMDEECWSNLEFCKSVNSHYFYAKTKAEKEALECAKRAGLNMVTVCPSFVIGPMLQSTLNATSSVFLKLLKEGVECMEDKTLHLVDVRDVAEALLLAYENAEANGRYLCTSYTIKTHGLVDQLKSMYPDCNFPKSFSKVEDDLKLSARKLQNLGWRYKSLEQTIADSVRNYQEHGLL